MNERIIGKVKVINEAGLHARAAAVLVETVNQFRCDIYLTNRGETVNAKSIMGVMMLGVTPGTEIEVTTDGTDAEDAMAAIVKVFADRFGEAK